MVLLQATTWQLTVTKIPLFRKQRLNAPTPLLQAHVPAAYSCTLISLPMQNCHWILPYQQISEESDSPGSKNARTWSSGSMRISYILTWTRVLKKLLFIVVSKWILPHICIIEWRFQICKQISDVSLRKEEITNFHMVIMLFLHCNYAFYAGSAKRSTPQNKVLDVKTIISLIRKFSGSGGKNEFQAISWYLLNNYNSINVKNKKNESFELYLECWGKEWYQHCFKYVSRNHLKTFTRRIHFTKL